MFRMPHREQPEVCLRDCDGVLLNLVENDPAEQELRTREGELEIKYGLSLFNRPYLTAPV
jgi:hypothetical protein